MSNEMKDIEQVGLPKEGLRTSTIYKEGEEPEVDTQKDDVSKHEECVCYFNGVKYSRGARVASAGRVLQCRARWWYHHHTPRDCWWRDIGPLTKSVS